MAAVTPDQALEFMRQAFMADAEGFLKTAVKLTAESPEFRHCAQAVLSAVIERLDRRALGIDSPSEGSRLLTIASHQGRSDAYADVAARLTRAANNMAKDEAARSKPNFDALHELITRLAGYVSKLAEEANGVVITANAAGATVVSTGSKLVN